MHINIYIYLCMYESIIEDSIEDMLTNPSATTLILVIIDFFMTYSLSHFRHKFHNEIVIDQYKNYEYIKC